MSRTLTKSDEGKTVVDASGEQVGTIDRVEYGTAYVEPDEGLLDELKAAIGSDDEGTHTIVGTDVETISDDDEEVCLRARR